MSYSRDGFPPIPFQVIVYVFTSHVAEQVMSLLGIVVGTAGLQPSNVYPVLVGFAGAVMAVPWFFVIGGT